MVGMAILIVAVVGVVGLHVVLASQRIVTRNAGSGAPALAGNIDPTKLKGEGDGRINILLLGIGGAGHDGPNLSDTMEVASIDPQTKDIAMLSIPRDLYVKIPGYGQSKINAANSLGGPELAKQVVSNILDLPIHYYIQVDFSGFKQAVDSVGGVNVTNAAALNDPEYPCDNDRGFCPFNLAAGSYHMSGTMALKFARCRHGSCGNDFGRAARQQQLLTALRQKALEASTLSNPVKLTGLVDSIGSHVRTDLQLGEMPKLASLIKDADSTKITQKVLDTSTSGLLIDGSGQFPGAGSIELPKAGAFDYSQIQDLAHTIFADSYLKTENANITVENATSKVGLADTVAATLKAYSYNVTAATNAPQTQAQTVIYDYSAGKKPYTISYLEKRFGVKSQAATIPANPGGVAPDITIILGSDYHSNAH
jgi:LCP family protein required for cell wall assembly